MKSDPQNQHSYSFLGSYVSRLDKICLSLVIAYLIMRDNTLSTVYMNDRFLCIITVPTLYTLEFIWTFICLHCWKYICKNKSIIIYLCIYISISIYFSVKRTIIVIVFRLSFVKYQVDIKFWNATFLPHNPLPHVYYQLAIFY